MSARPSRLWRFLIPVVAGAFLTAASLLVRWEFCMDGDARGVPFAIIHPTHGNSTFFVLLDPDSKISDEVDFDKLLANLVT